MTNMQHLDKIDVKTHFPVYYKSRMNKTARHRAAEKRMRNIGKLAACIPQRNISHVRWFHTSVNHYQAPVFSFLPLTLCN